MKKALLAIVSCTFVATASFASPSQNDVSNLSLNKSEMSALFGNAKVEQVAILSQEEMKSTEGEWVPFFNMAIYGYRAYQFYRAVPYSAKLGYTLGFGWASDQAW